MRLAVLLFVTVVGVNFYAALGFIGHGVHHLNRRCYYDDNHLLCRWNTNHRGIGHIPLGADSDRDRARYESNRGSKYYIRLIKPKETSNEKTKTTKALVLELESEPSKHIRLVKPKETTKTTKALVLELESDPSKHIRLVKPKETSDEKTKTTKTLVLELEHEPSKHIRVVKPKETSNEKTKTTKTLVLELEHEPGTNIHLVQPEVSSSEKSKSLILEV